uniref:Uncharacterized protein n=1 Tax=Meloidogyne javanica TaxID=6303 RepID=A0A915LBM7_MELJA
MPFFNLNKNGSSHEKKCFNNRCDLEESIAVDYLLNENNESNLAIMTDAFHMISDLSSFLVSILAIRLSRRQPNIRHSYGFQRAEMEASPQFVSHDKIYKNLLSLPNVVGIHSLRVWALKSDTLAATVHLELEENSDANKVSIMAQHLLAKIHRIRFSTVQSHCNQFKNNIKNKNEFLVEINEEGIENNKELQTTINSLEKF